MINQNVLRQHGIEDTDASNIMHKLVTIGAQQTIAKTIITYQCKGKTVKSIVFVNSIDITNAINVLSGYLSKEPYSKRVNVAKWTWVMQLLQSIKEKRHDPV